MRSRSCGVRPFLSASAPRRLGVDLRGLHEIAAAVGMSDSLDHIIVGNPDPTSDLYRGKGYRECGFEWFDDTCLTLVLRWQCTRESDHPGQHLAGTGYKVAALHHPEKLEATGRNT
jgi:hypothetical protein